MLISSFADDVAQQLILLVGLCLSSFEFQSGANKRNENTPKKSQKLVRSVKCYAEECIDQMNWCANSNVLQPVVQRNPHAVSYCMHAANGIFLPLFDSYMKVCGSRLNYAFTLTKKGRRTMKSD